MAIQKFTDFSFVYGIAISLYCKQQRTSGFGCDLLGTGFTFFFESACPFHQGAGCMGHFIDVQYIALQLCESLIKFKDKHNDIETPKCQPMTNEKPEK